MLNPPEPRGQNHTHLLVFKILNGLCIGLLVPHRS